MTWEEAIYKVLDECPEPMHYVGIAKSVVTGNLVEHNGSNPAAVAATTLSNIINSGGGTIKRLGGGLYTLTEKTIAKTVSGEMTWQPSNIFRRCSVPDREDHEVNRISPISGRAVHEATGVADQQMGSWI